MISIFVGKDGKTIVGVFDQHREKINIAYEASNRGV